MKNETTTEAENTEEKEVKRTLDSAMTLERVLKTVACSIWHEYPKADPKYKHNDLCILEDMDRAIYSAKRDFPGDKFLEDCIAHEKGIEKDLIKAGKEKDQKLTDEEAYHKAASAYVAKAAPFGQTDEQRYTRLYNHFMAMSIEKVARTARWCSDRYEKAVKDSGS